LAHSVPMQKVVLVTLLLCITVFATQSEHAIFKANFELRRPNTNGAVVTGVLTYDGPRYRFRHDYPARTYAEIFKYNSLYGTDPRCTIDQWMYLLGSSCESGCRAARIDDPYPVYTLNTKVYKLVDEGILIGSRNCSKYQPIKSSSSPLSSIYFTDAGVICRAVWKDGREYTFTSYEQVDLTGTTLFDEPTTCVCGDKLDLLILVDRSGSIDKYDFDDARRFARTFTRKFTLSPAQVHVAIALFDTETELIMDFYEGTSHANLDAAINAMKCDCPAGVVDVPGALKENLGKKVCCKRRTSISQALDAASEYLRQNGRPDARKAVLVITDGRHNTDANGTACMTARQCDKDLEEAILRLVGSHTKLEVYGAGCGNTLHDKMALIVGGRYEKLTNTSDYWEERQFYLHAAVGCQDPVYYCDPAACDGLCECSVCRAPDACDDTGDFCMRNVLNVAARKCEQRPYICPQSSNLCRPSVCNSTLQQCVEYPVECPPAPNDCFENQCIPTEGACESRRRTIIPGINPHCQTAHACQTDADCADNDACTNEFCDKSGPFNVCRYPAKICNDGNLCTLDLCNPVEGCRFIPVPADFCNDYVDCTHDYCDPNANNGTGQCVNELIKCDDGLDCTHDYCDDSPGGSGTCRYEPIPCPVSNNNCTLTYCHYGGCESRYFDNCLENLEQGALPGWGIGLIALAAIVGAAGVAGLTAVVLRIHFAGKVARAGGRAVDFASE